ncbi:hypothetical protein H6P81_021675 [Aristolochia fimbriata]|uniref:Uncharacterized protein n=1 Tax=Aristolochia fimbriata TaxID=158543 RepID=A0AAV7DPA5_ARIFI|nr:hypothetical protein H6P81_021675 [Aristolochia fimbriata]
MRKKDRKRGKKKEKKREKKIKRKKEKKEERKERKNVVVQIIVQAAKEYPQPLGVDACIRLFEQFKSYEGSYFFLGTYLSSGESGNGPLVVVQLLDDECPEDFINLSVLSFQRILLWCNVGSDIHFKHVEGAAKTG